MKKDNGEEGRGKEGQGGGRTRGRKEWGRKTGGGRTGTEKTKGKKNGGRKDGERPGSGTTKSTSWDSTTKNKFTGVGQETTPKELVPLVQRGPAEKGPRGSGMGRTETGVWTGGLPGHPLVRRRPLRVVRTSGPERFGPH